MQSVPSFIEDNKKWEKKKKNKKKEKSHATKER
jgi:hypothetical protein